MNNQPSPPRVEKPPSLVRVASDELLLLGARLHDDVALGVLFDRYGAEAYGVALETLRESDAAESAMQDAFLRIWRGIEIYDASYGTTRDWLVGIARGRALNALARLEPFGGVPDRVVSLDDISLLAPPEPSSGSRDRLLARARAEGGGARAADAPAVVIPAAELGPEPASHLDLATDDELALDVAPSTDVARPSDAELTLDVARASEAELAMDSALVSGLKLDADEQPAAGAWLRPDDEPVRALSLVQDDEPTVEAALVPELQPTIEAERDADDLMTAAATLDSDDRPTVEAALSLDDRPTVAASPILDDEPDADVELASEAPTLTGLPILPSPTVNRQYVVVDADPVTEDVTLPTAPDVETESVTQEAATATDSSVEAEAEDVTEAVTPPTLPLPIPLPAPATDPNAVTIVAATVVEPPQPARNLAEMEPSEALAAALAPIQPRRPQPRRVVDEPRRKGGIKLTTICCAVALVFVLASGLFVTAWSATGPHLSPDLNVLSRLPGGRIVALRGVGTPTASARLHSVDSGRRAELSVESLPPLPSGRVYQVWLTEPGQQPRSAGSFLVNRRGDAVIAVSLGGPVERLLAIAITQEPAPGTLAPSGLKVLEGSP